MVSKCLYVMTKYICECYNYPLIMLIINTTTQNNERKESLLTQPAQTAVYLCMLGRSKSKSFFLTSYHAQYCILDGERRRIRENIPPLPWSEQWFIMRECCVAFSTRITWGWRGGSSGYHTSVKCKFNYKSFT